MIKCPDCNTPIESITVLVDWWQVAWRPFSTKKWRDKVRGFRAEPCEHGIVEFLMRAPSPEPVYVRMTSGKEQGINV
jgi:hypothetical protein